MAKQFDVFRNPIALHRSAYPIVVVLQSPFAALAKSRIVAPAIRVQPGIDSGAVLTPRFTVGDEDYTLHTFQLTSVLTTDLKDWVGNIADPILEVGRQHRGELESMEGIVFIPDREAWRQDRAAIDAGLNPNCRSDDPGFCQRRERRLEDHDDRVCGSMQRDRIAENVKLLCHPPSRPARSPASGRRKDRVPRYRRYRRRSRL